MGQPTRIGIVELRKERKMTVGEIADRLCGEMTNVYNHLSLLLGLGIVRGSKGGLTTHCNLAMPELDTFIRCVEN